MCTWLRYPYCSYPAVKKQWDWVFLTEDLSLVRILLHRHSFWKPALLFCCKTNFFSRYVFVKIVVPWAQIKKTKEAQCVGQSLHTATLPLVQNKRLEKMNGKVESSLSALKFVLSYLCLVWGCGARRASSRVFFFLLQFPYPTKIPGWSCQ